jgi:hypothetical protein
VRSKRLPAWIGVALLVAEAGYATALEPITDHRDQWGLTLSVGTVFDTAIDQKQVFSYEPGFQPILEIGATRAVTDTGDEETVRVRLTSPVSGSSTSGSVLQAEGDKLNWLGPSLIGGYRGYFGYDSFRTFYDADLFVNSYPFWGVGPNVGLGAQYDFGRIAGVFLRLGFGVTFGETIIASFDGSLGGQVRF